MYNGKKCASTTRYADYHKGACGCGPADNDNQVERVVNPHCLIYGITTLNWHNVPGAKLGFGNWYGKRFDA
ncbi:hypothetical protein DPMN_157806 [Dreissena polymorpha]|uniref:Uncharacterized protein n=1 Tax=Dreissena polymorpha TaxID=45954 RepID=A0A9D4EGP9_DREPO|nr:hypothetical protein DPMN_157806 [Dreissena polymorpha]